MIAFSTIGAFVQAVTLSVLVGFEFGYKWGAIVFMAMAFLYSLAQVIVDGSK